MQSEVSTNVRRLECMRRFGAVIALAVLLCPGCALTPTGSYPDVYIGSTVPNYWVFKSGSVCLREKGAKDIPLGTYHKSDKGWVLRGDPKDGEVLLFPGVFGIRMVSDSKLYMNRYLPRRGLTWANSQKSDSLHPEQEK
jgi:hypothetical protein